VGLEYRGWGPSRRWRGHDAEAPFPELRVPDVIALALMAADPAPPWNGSSKKHFDDVFSRVFYGWDSKLLTPDDARVTAEWIREWGRESERSPQEARAAIVIADRLEAMAEHNWYLDWAT